MAYKNFDNGFEGLSAGNADTSLTLQADGQDSLALPDASYVRDADIMRDGMDLVLDGPQGHLTIEDYFAGDHAPMLTADDGSSLSPDLVNSFVKSAPQYAQNMSVTDESPVGAVQEIVGEATVTHPDGSAESIGLGTPIYQGDIVETGADGAVNIAFIDDSSFAVSEDARLAIDEYVFDAGTEAGTQDFSVLKGVFVFTSGLIGREDPDDVNIDTPVGSIGIRGTIIAGDVDAGEITVIEGAIVLRDFEGNEMTLASEFETGTFKPGQGIENNGQKAANDVAEKFQSVSKVSPNLFSSINDAAAEALDAEGVNDDVQPEDMLDEAPDSADGEGENTANPDGSVDQDGDNAVDGTVDDGTGEQLGDGEVNEQTLNNSTDGQQDASTPSTTDTVVVDNAEAFKPAHRNALTDHNTTNSTTDSTTQQTTQTQPVSNTDGTEPPPPSDTTEPPPPSVYNGDDSNTGPTVFKISALPDLNADGFHEATSGGITYEGDMPGTAVNDKFTNKESGGSNVAHQDISVNSGFGNDQLVFDNDGTRLHLETINAGAGDDHITLKLFNGVDLDIQKLNGGAGAGDELKITSTSSSILDFTHIASMKGIEQIVMDADGNAQTIHLTGDMIFQNTLTSESITSEVGLYSNMRTLTITGEDTLDTANIDLDSNWSKLSFGIEESDTGFERYEATIDGESVRLLVDVDLSGAVNIAV